MKHKGIQPGLEWAVAFYTDSLLEYDVTRASIIDAGNIRIWFKRKKDGQVSSQIFPFQSQDADSFKYMVEVRGSKPKAIKEEIIDVEAEEIEQSNKAYSEIKV